MAVRKEGNKAQMKEQDKIPEKELNEMEKTNLSDAEKHWSGCSENSEYCKNIREEIKVTLSEIKKNLQGSNSGEEKAEKAMIWNTRKEKAFNQNSRKKKEFKKQQQL